VLTAPHQPYVALMQALLRLPGERCHLRTAVPLPGRERLADGRAVPISPGRFHHDAPQVGVAGLADRPAADALAARVLARDRPRVAHELALMLKARQLPHLGHDRHG